MKLILKDIGSPFGLIALAVWIRVFVPGVVNYVQEPHRSVVVGASSPRTAISAMAAEAATALIVLVCAAVIFRGPRTKVASLGHTILVLAPILIVASQRTVGGTLLGPTGISLAIAVLVVIAVRVSAPNMRQVSLIGVAGAASSLGSVLMGILIPANSYFVDLYGTTNNSTKSLIGSNQLAGIFGHSNTLGLVAVSSIPFLLYRPRSRTRLVLLAACVVAIAWSASRTTLLALGVLLVVSLVGRAVRTSTGRDSTWIAALVALPVIAVPLLTRDPAAFTFRGQIWSGSLDAWRGSLLLGGGPDWYSVVGNSTQALGNQAASGHNFFVHVVATSGLVGLTVFAALFVRAFRVASEFPDDRSTTAVRRFLGVALSVSVFEATWSSNPGGELFQVTLFAVAAIVLSAPDRGLDVPCEPERIIGVDVAARS